ncbi:MAG: LON peptidase substrate-binding domain-containing protein [bacterium]
MGKPDPEHEAALAALERLKIFPLPGSVLVPAGYLPLHVFEPRYREMTADCLAGDRVLAVATLAPGWETNYEGRPPIFPVMGVGYIEKDEKLSNGRFNILLRGLFRVRMLDEHPATRAYREIQAARIPDVVHAQDREQLGSMAITLQRLVLDLATAMPDSSARPLSRAAAAERDPGRLADLVGAAVLTDAEPRQSFLEEVDVRRRIEAATERVSQMLLQVSQPMGGEA